MDDFEEECNNETVEKTARAVIDYIMSHPNIPKNRLSAIKGHLGKKFGFKNVIRDSQILAYATPQELEKLIPLLRRRSTRTLSGVTIVAVMIKPYQCPGHCIYCPGPDSQPGKKVAQSYTGKEPAALRSAMYEYDSYQQTLHRLIDQQAIGHEIDKIELIIMGGTFLYTPLDYQEEFVKGCFDAIINFKEPNYNSHKRTTSFSEAKLQLETAKTRLIGLTLETRPDYCTEKYVDRMLELGATRVEIGVQTTFDDILEYVCRGANTSDSIKAIQIAKDAGLKVNVHMMPNLPKSNPDRDRQMFLELFENTNYRPDMMKIYPTLVIQGTLLYELYKKGEYTPYPQEEVVKVIADAKLKLPPYVRIQRVQRDIPAYLIVDGVKNSNLRQMVEKELISRGKECNCIRCREEGFSHQKGARKRKLDVKNIEFIILKYESSEGIDFFISLEDIPNGVLVGFVRLRFPSKKAHRIEFKNDDCAIIREIRVVGEIVVHNNMPKENQIQHRGYGKQLMAKTEEIALQYSKHKLFVIAGIGARPYFYNLGYKPDGPYVSKELIEKKII